MYIIWASDENLNRKQKFKGENRWQLYTHFAKKDKEGFSFSLRKKKKEIFDSSQLQESFGHHPQVSLTLPPPTLLSPVVDSSEIDFLVWKISVEFLNGGNLNVYDWLTGG